jgi:hypothetical protein
VDDDAWHDAMTRHDQVHEPIRGALEYALGALGADAPGARDCHVVSFTGYPVKLTLTR